MRDAETPTAARVLTVAQMAAALQCSEATVRRKCQAGAIPGAHRTKKKTGHWRAHRAVFELWIDRGCPPRY